VNDTEFDESMKHLDRCLEEAGEHIGNMVLDILRQPKKESLSRSQGLDKTLRGLAVMVQAWRKLFVSETESGGTR
jgi:hypothetical protein